RRPLTILVIDAALVVAVMIGTAVAWERIIDWLVEHGADVWFASAALLAIAGLLAGLFLIAIAPGAVRLARIFAAQMIPGAPADPLPGAARVVAPPAALDLGRAPRRALVVVLELAIALVVGLPIAAVTQPFVPGGGLVALVAIILLALAAQRSIT